MPLVVFSAFTIISTPSSCKAIIQIFIDQSNSRNGLSERPPLHTPGAKFCASRYASSHYLPLRSDAAEWLQQPLRRASNGCQTLADPSTNIGTQGTPEALIGDVAWDGGPAATPPLPPPQAPTPAPPLPPPPPPPRPPLQSSSCCAMVLGTNEFAVSVWVNVRTSQNRSTSTPKLRGLSCPRQMYNCAY
jgi:hypothetical protein